MNDVEGQETVSPVLVKKNSLRMPLPPNSDVKVREMHHPGANTRQK